MKNFNRLEQSNYTFAQYESLTIDITRWGLDSIYFESSSQAGACTVNLNPKKMIYGLSSLIGVSTSNILSIKALRSDVNISGIAQLNSTYKLVMDGKSPFIIGVSYLDEESHQVEAGITISYANGTFNLIDFVSGGFNIEDYIEGTAKSVYEVSGELDTIGTLNGTLNIIEIFSGEYSSPQNGG